jgi:hypothetical protein
MITSYTRVYPKVSVAVCSPAVLEQMSTYQFIKNRQLVFPPTIDLQLASVLLLLGKQHQLLSGGCFDEH